MVAADAFEAPQVGSAREMVYPADPIQPEVTQMIPEMFARFIQASAVTGEMGSVFAL